MCPGKDHAVVVLFKIKHWNRRNHSEVERTPSGAAVSGAEYADIGRGVYRVAGRITLVNEEPQHWDIRKGRASAIAIDTAPCGTEIGGFEYVSDTGLGCKSRDAEVPSLAQRHYSSGHRRYWPL